jgi:hypothetical protein
MARQADTGTAGLAPGAVVYDAGTRRIGEYRGMGGPYAMLRPLGGGREWEAEPARIRPATPAERLTADGKTTGTPTGRPP